MAAQAYYNNTNIPFERAGDGFKLDNETFEQDAGRATLLAQYTVVAQKAASRKWVPVTDVDPALTRATLVCGANGGNLAAWQAVSDGEFAITVDGEAIDVTGIDTSSITALTEIVDLIRNAILDKFDVEYDVLNDTFSFASPTEGIYSTISVLSAVSGGSGTDISGAGFLNGLTGTGTATQGTGGDGSDVPLGIVYNEITAAALVAGDVTGNLVLAGGNIAVDRDQVVLEGSLALTDVVTATGKTIEATLRENGIFLQYAHDLSAHQA